MSINNHIYYGSSCTPNITELNIVIDKLISHIKNISNDNEDFIKFHNCYTCYTALLLFYATGHRPVKDPFCYYSDIDLVNRHILIDDKTTSENKRYRLVPLTDLAVQQLIEYNNHLKWLKCHANINDGLDGLDKAIKKMQMHISSKDNIEIPYLFLLKKNKTTNKIKSISISEKTLNKELGDFWKYPFNQPRHMIASDLREIIYAEIDKPNNISNIDIKAYLGHAEQLSQPFGKSSALVFNDHKKHISHHINNLMTKQGWKVITSKKNWGHNYSSKRKWRHEKRNLGPKERLLTRRKNRKNDLIVVKNALLHYSHYTSLTQEHIDEISQTIISESVKNEKRIPRRLSLMRAILPKEVKNNAKIKIPNNHFSFSTEKSPFNKNTILDYRNSVELRKNFLNYLSKNGRAEPNASNICSYTRLAEIVISAALIDCVSNKKTLGLITDSELIVIHEKEFCFIDLIGNSGELEKRWFPLQLSLALLYSRLKISNLKTSSRGRLLSEICRIINKLQPKCILNKNIISFIANSAKNFSLLNTPGYMHNVITGSTSQQPLPQSTFIRILRDEKLISKHKQSGARNNDKHITNIRNHPYDLINENDLFHAKDFVTKFNTTLLETTKITSKNRSGAEKNKKKIFTTSINNLVKPGHNFSEIAVLICSWSLKLCKEGTDIYNGEITFGTVDEYTRLVTKALIYQLYMYDKEGLKNADYSFIYELALEINNYGDKSKLSNNLEDFHNFLVKHKITDPINWKPLNDYVKNTKQTSRVDANFITYNEYYAALNILHNMPANKSHVKQLEIKYAALIILGYRFGLRISESYQLTYNNIQISNDFSFIIINITNNRHKDPKSSAGRRPIPIIGELTTIEKDILESVFNLPENLRPTTNEVFFDPNDQNELLNYAHANITIKNALTLVTGEENIRYHHLRHSFDNIIYTLSFNDINNFSNEFTQLLGSANLTNNSALIRLLTGKYTHNSNILNALSAIIGHSSINVSLKNYIHTTDYHHHCWIKNKKFTNIANNKMNTDFISAYSTGLKYQYVKKKRQSKGIPTSDIESTLSELININKFPMSLIKTESISTSHQAIKESNGTLNSISILHIDSILLLANETTEVDLKKITNTFHLPKETIKTVLNTFIDTYKSSGYANYLNHATNKARSKNKNSTSSLKETIRLRNYISKHLSNIDDLDDKDLNILYDGLSQWALHYRPSKQVTGIIFGDPGPVDAFTQSLALLNIKPDHLMAKITDDFSAWYEIVDIENPRLVIRTQNNIDLCIKNYKVTNNIPLSLTKSKYLSKKRLSISLLQRGGHPLYSNKTLDRLCFLTLIYTSLRTKYL